MKNLKPYETDATGIEGKALDLIQPTTIAGVKEAVRLNSKITIRGGGSGLAGGAVPQNSTILDLSKLDVIGKFDEQRKTIEVEAGVVLDDLQDFVSNYGLEFPVNPSSHAIATIGGMIATNAVGSRAIKYGKTSDWVNWIEVVDSNGEIEKKTKTELSDYVGMEGITGVIVKAELKLTTAKSRTANLFSSEDLDEIIELVRQAKRETDVSMTEFFDKKISKLIGLDEKYYLFIEYESDKGKLKNEKYKELTRTRDSAYPLLAKEGFTHIEDPKVLTDRSKKLLQWLESKGVPFFGHLGVGIVHPCFKQNKESEKLIEQMMTIVKQAGGRVSGEHGIGITKKQFVDAGDRKILLNMKKRLDSQQRFNPGVIL